MVKWLFKHQWKRWARSTIWQKSLVLNIVIGVLLLLLILDILFLGIMIDKILIMSFPDQDPVVKFNGFLLYYFMIDLVLRFYIQGLPTIVVESFLHLPV